MSSPHAGTLPLSHDVGLDHSSGGYCRATLPTYPHVATLLPPHWIGVTTNEYGPGNDDVSVRSTPLPVARITSNVLLMGLMRLVPEDGEEWRGGERRGEMEGRREGRSDERKEGMTKERKEGCQQ